MLIIISVHVKERLGDFRADKWIPILIPDALHSISDAANYLYNS